MTIKLGVATLMSSLTCDEMRSRIEILKTETDAMEKRLKLLRSGTRSVDPEQKRLVDKQLDIYQREWRRRRRMVSLFVGNI